MQSVARRRIRCHHLACHSYIRIPWQLCHGRPTIVHNAGAPAPCVTAQIKRTTASASTIHVRPSPIEEAKSSSSSHSQEKVSLLLRARVHGIEDWKRLVFEADLSRARVRGKKLVFDDSVRQDLDLWSVLLDYRHMKDGQKGIRIVLDSMLYDGDPVRLQADSVSEHIWRIILSVALNDKKLLHELCNNGTSFMRDRPLVFADVVGHLLKKNDLHLAIVAATQLLISHFRGRIDSIHLFDLAMQANHPLALHNFCELLSRLPLHKIYSDIVPKIWAAGRPRDAFLVHDHLLSMGDLPNQFELVEPFIRELASSNTDIEPFLEHLESCGIAFSHQARQLYNLEKAQFAFQSNKSANYLLSQGPGFRPMKLSDAFVARTFATKSVSFEFVLNGLRLVGLFEIGPLAVREIALTAGNITTLRQRFQKLESMNVDLGASNYVRVIRNLCMSDKADLLRAILQSDMHHEVFEDIQKQKYLLTEYDRVKDWSEVNRTLAILNGGETGRKADMHAANFLLQSCLVRGKWRSALQRMDDLKQLTKGSVQRLQLAPLRMAWKRIWAGNTKVIRQDKSFLDRYRYLVGFMQLAHMVGLQAYPWQWRSVLYAVGRSGDWDLFQSLIIAVAKIFQGRLPSDQDAQLNLDQDQGAILDNVFDASMQVTTIEFAVMTEGSDQNAEQAWLRGMNLLSRLSSTFGLQIDYHTVLDAFEGRLNVLFDDPNPIIRESITSSYIRQFNWAWKECGKLELPDTPLWNFFRKCQKPDVTSLKLLQLRTKLVHLRKEPVGQLDVAHVGHVDAQDLDDGIQKIDSMGTADEEGTAVSGEALLQQTSTLEDNTTVFYEDLLHPSYLRSKDVSE